MIDISQIIVKEFNSKNKGCLGVSKMEKDFVATLTDSQKLTFENIRRGYEYSIWMSNRDLVEFVLDFVATINGRSCNRNIFFS